MAKNTEKTVDGTDDLEQNTLVEQANPEMETSVAENELFETIEYSEGLKIQIKELKIERERKISKTTGRPYNVYFVKVKVRDKEEKAYLKSANKNTNGTDMLDSVFGDNSLAILVFSVLKIKNQVTGIIETHFVYEMEAIDDEDLYCQVKPKESTDTTRLKYALKQLGYIKKV